MPTWVEDCIKRYMRKEGLSKEEASKRCYGAWEKRKKRKKRKKKEK